VGITWGLRGDYVGSCQTCTVALSLDEFNLVEVLQGLVIQVALILESRGGQSNSPYLGCLNHVEGMVEKARVRKIAQKNAAPTKSCLL